MPEKYEKLKGLLNRIETVNMIVINFYFKKDILPVKVKKAAIVLDLNFFY